MNNNEQSALWLHTVTRWIMAQPRKCLLDSYDKVFRYVAFSAFTRKMSVVQDMGIIKAVIFHWPDNVEHIELKAQENRQQFEFEPMRKGNAIFVGEVVGDRESVAKCYKTLLAEHPHLFMCPIFTYRHGKLTRLSHRVLERLCYRKGVV